MKRIESESLTDNFIQTIGKEWMLISAGNRTSFNLMTASWGGVGFMWNKPVVFVVVRPERHTYQFIEERDSFVLSFLGNESKARDIYSLCGTKSGRELDKVAATGLTPLTTPEDEVAFEEARLTLVCRKLYATEMKKEDFIDETLPPVWYEKKGNFHKMYVAEIVQAYTQE